MISGRVTAVHPARLDAEMYGVACGDAVRVSAETGAIDGTVTELAGGRITIAPFAQTRGVRTGDVVTSSPSRSTRLGMTLLGRAVNYAGLPIDGRPVDETRVRSHQLVAPPPATRVDICEPFWTCIRALDALLTFGRGARIGIFGGPGLGKSTLLEMLVDHATADAVVVGLTGERGREAERWLSRNAAHTTLVVATSDTSAHERIAAARRAMAQACALRSSGLHVLLLLDSLARYAAALREAAIAAGEPVGRAGYPASVFVELARFVECAGATRDGSVTMIATVLSDGDERDPVSDAARSLLDGHIQLSAALAQRGHFPAIDIPASVSRTMPSVIDAAHRANAAVIRGALAALQRSADARAAGIMPMDDHVLRAVAAEAALERFLRQANESVEAPAALAELAALADTLEEDSWTSPPTSPP